MLYGLYITSAIVGWVLVGLMVAFGGDTGMDVDTDIDLDVDLDLDLDLDLDVEFESPDGLDVSGVGSTLDSFGEIVLGMLSIRSMLFFAAGFGGAGLLATWMSGSSFAALPFAIAAGVIGSYANSALMKWMRGSELDSQLQKSDIAGSSGKVVVPVGPGQKGRIAIQIGDRPIMMVAQSYNDKSGDQLAVGDSVVIIDTDERGTALVARLDDLANG